MYTVSNEFDNRESGNAILSTLADKEVIGLLDQELPVYFREDWIRLINNLRLPKNRKDVLLEKILEILKEKGFDTTEH